PNEQVQVVSLHLRQPDYLPIEAFVDREAGTLHGLDADAPDPLAGLLADLGDLPDGWRALAQLILYPAPPDCCRGYLPLAEEPAPRPAPMPRGEAETSSATVALLAVLLVLTAIGLQGYLWYLDGDWLDLALLVGGVLGIVGAAAWLLARL